VSIGMRQLLLDTETTGLEPEKGHKIIEFAALEMIDRKLTGNHLHLYINPERLIDEGAMRIHGITNEQVQDKPVVAEVVKDIVSFIADSELIIHNAKFDLGFLDYQLKETGYTKTTDYVLGVIDTLLMARQKFPGAKNNLDALCDRFKVDRSNRDYHGALVDCQLLSHVYLGLTREQISLLGDEVSKVGADKFEFKKLENLNLKVIHATKDELVLHTKYLEALDKAYKGKSQWFNTSIKDISHG